MTAPLGKHRHDCHNGEDYEVICRISAVETEIATRKALEAFYILARNPYMNKCFSITNDSCHLFHYVSSNCQYGQSSLLLNKYRIVTLILLQRQSLAVSLILSR